MDGRTNELERLGAALSVDVFFNWADTVVGIFAGEIATRGVKGAVAQGLIVEGGRAGHFYVCAGRGNQAGQDKLVQHFGKGRTGTNLSKPDERLENQSVKCDARMRVVLSRQTIGKPLHKRLLFEGMYCKDEHC